LLLGEIFRKFGGMRGTEDAELGTGSELAVEDSFLSIVVFGEGHERTHCVGRCGSGGVRIRGFDRGGQPRLIAAQNLPNGMENFRAVVFEIEVEVDQRPMRAIVLGKCLFDEGLNALEKIRFEIGLGAFGLSGVRDDNAALIPGKVLLDRDWVSGAESAVDTVGIAAIVGVAIVGVDYGLGVQGD